MRNYQIFLNQHRPYVKLSVLAELYDGETQIHLLPQSFLFLDLKFFVDDGKI